MKINNLGVPTPSLIPQSLVQASADGDQAAASVSADNPGYTPSSELQNLISLTRQEPEIRENLVQAAAQRLQEGYYHTPASIENTAAAMLQ